MSETSKEEVKERVTGRPEIFIREWFADYLWDLFCPGCQTPVVARAIAEVLVELGIVDRAIMVGCVGCSGILIGGFDLDRVSPAHGRGPDVATAIKRIYPDTIVFTVQGDGDCIAIGSSSLVARSTKWLPVQALSTTPARGSAGSAFCSWLPSVIVCPDCCCASADA